METTLFGKTKSRQILWMVHIDELTLYESFFLMISTNWMIILLLVKEGTEFLFWLCLFVGLQSWLLCIDIVCLV